MELRSKYRWRAEGREPWCRICRRPRSKMTPEERERYRRWWIESSGLTARELHEIAVGLGGA